MNQEKYHTSTLLKASFEIDTGIILREKSIEIYPNDTAYELWCRSVNLSSELLIEYLANINSLKSFDLGNYTLKEIGNFYPKNSLEKLKLIPNSLY